MSRFKSLTTVVLMAFVLLLAPATMLSFSAAQAQSGGDLIQSNLSEFVPAWVKEGGRSAMLQRMTDPALRQLIEAEINTIVEEKVDGGAEGILLPDEGETVGEWMTAFDRETTEDYELAPGQALFSFVNLNYDEGNTFYVDEFEVIDVDRQTTAFRHDFTGTDGDSWSRSAFGANLFSYPRNPDAVTYTIEDNVGVMDVEKRQQGTSSSYGKLTPVMSDLDNSEVRMRFRVDNVGLTQYVRVWIQSDEYGSGSSFARNGYGIALHLGHDEVTLQQRENASTTALGKAPANMTTDWHQLRLRAADGKVSVKLWNDNEEEPADWQIEHALPEVENKAMLSFANLDPVLDNAVYIDTLGAEAVSSGESLFDHSFAGADGAAWEPEAFELLHAHGVTYSIEDNTGKVAFPARENALDPAYGKLVPVMGNAVDSQLTMRFRVEEPAGDQWVRAFVKADEFLEGNSAPKNGYGVELNLKTQQLRLFEMENKNTFRLAQTGMDLDADWHWLKLRIAGDELAVRLWKDGDEEPAQWNMTHRVSENVSAGEAIMRLLVIRGDMTTIYTSLPN